MKSLEGRQLVLLWTVLTGSARTNLIAKKGPIEAPGGKPASRKLLEKPFVLSMKHEVSRTHHLLPGVIREGRQLSKDGLCLFWMKDQFYCSFLAYRFFMLDFSGWKNTSLIQNHFQKEAPGLTPWRGGSS